jgi:hypothetical protein
MLGVAPDHGCLILVTTNELFELYLPKSYRTRNDSGQVQVVGPDGVVVASEGDRIGVDGELGHGGSYCTIGPQLNATAIVALAPLPSAE